MFSVLDRSWTHPVDHLVRGPHRQLVAFPERGGRMRLHHRVRLVRGGVGGVEFHGRCIEAALEVAGAGVGRVVFPVRLDRLVLLGGQVEASFLFDVFHAHEGSGGARLLEGLGHHQGHGLVVVLDLGAGQQVGDVLVALAQLAGIGGRDHGQHAGRAARGLDLDRGDAALGDAGADHEAVGGVRHFLVVLVGVGRRAGAFERAVDAIERLADVALAVDGIGGGGSGEFHGVSLSSLRSSLPRGCGAPGPP